MRSELEPLVEVYTAARLRWTDEHPPTGPGVCRYCGERWTMWPGSRLDGHAACYVPPAFWRELRAFLSGHPGVTFADVATALDVSVAVVRRWWDESLRDPDPRRA